MKPMVLITRLTEGAVAVLLAMMTLLVAVEVFLRYVVGTSLFFSEELARFLFVWVSFLAASLAVRSGVHVGLEFFVERLPRPVRRRLAILVQGPVLAFLAMIVITGIAMVVDSAGERSATLGVHMSWARAAVPLGGVLMFLQVLDGLARLRSGEAISAERSGVE